jgi:excisionase family DNA binding protein
VEELLKGGDAELRLVDTQGRSAVLPEELRKALGAVVASMHKRQAVAVAALAPRLTTQQAADHLGVSRPTLIKLLEEGKIPYETPNRHRRIRLVDLLTYQQTRQAEYRHALGELAREAQELGLYETSSEDYEAVLSEVRHKLA